MSIARASREGTETIEAGRVYVLGIGVKGSTSCETVVGKVRLFRGHFEWAQLHSRTLAVSGRS